jgi:hypothetical protein
MSTKTKTTKSISLKFSKEADDVYSDDGDYIENIENTEPSYYGSLSKGDGIYSCNFEIGAHSTSDFLETLQEVVELITSSVGGP